MALPIEKIRKALSDGLLSFPVTDMDKNGRFNPGTFVDRLSWFLDHDISAIFVAGGTGEFYSLSTDEYRKVVKVATETVKGKVPVISSAGRSVPEAIESASIAEKAGIDALLLMPPYLVNAPQEGIFEYAKTIIENINLPVIYYNRSNGVLTSAYVEKLAAACSNLIGLKDGTGNIQELNDTIKTLGDRLVFIGGVPTAEIISEAYLSIGVNTYSSAVFNFVPDLSNYFYKSLRSGNREVVQKILKEFFIPFVRLRNIKSGYAVSLIKAGAKLMGRDAGNVRAPLTMPTDDEMSELKNIIDRGMDVLE